jgi:hypothetical protein
VREWLRLAGLGGGGGVRGAGLRHWCVEQAACSGDVVGARAVGEQTVVADAVEAVRQDVNQETSDELAGGCSTALMSEPEAVRNVTGDYQLVGVCTYEALDRAYPGFIKMTDSANATIMLTYDVAIGETPYREFEATIAKVSDGVASVTVKERQTLGGTIDRFTKQIITTAETCAAELSPAARRKCKVCLFRRGRSGKKRKVRAIRQAGHDPREGAWRRSGSDRRHVPALRLILGDLE